MFYVVTDRGVVIAEKLVEINKKMSGEFDINEFVAVGPDYVTKVTDRDLDFVQDKKKMSNILFSNFFKKDKTVKLICAGCLIVSLINLMIASQFMNMLKNFLGSINVS